MTNRGGAAIRFVTRKWPPAIGGMETYSARLADSLSAYADVEAIALPGRPDGSPPTVLALLGFGLRTAVRLLLARPREITHIADMASWPFALLARLRSKRIRIALSAHGTDVSFPLREGPIARLYGLYLKIGARLLPSAIVVANSTATAEAAKTYGFKYIAVVPLATDSHGTVIPERHSTSLLFVGRLVPRKGCAWFIRNVLPLLPAEVTLRVAGTKWDKNEEAAMSNPRVTFLGPVQGDALIREYASAMCVVVPNVDVPTREFEGFGLTAVEAAASGGLVLASRHSGLKEAVIDGVTGFHLPPGDADAWARKIRDVGDWRDDRRRAFIADAMSATRQYYTWERVARETLTAYSQTPPALTRTRPGGTADSSTV